MTEQTPTPEQIAAVEWLRLKSDATSLPGSTHARVILDSLDPALTTPQPALPTEPGFYLTPNKSVITLDDEGDWTWGDGDLVYNPAALMPLRRLVPERPPITREQIVELLRKRGAADYILALVNGTDR